MPGGLSYGEKIDANMASQISSISEGFLDFAGYVKTEWELKEYFIRKLLNFRFLELSKIMRPLNGTGFFHHIDEDSFAAGVLGRDDLEKRGISIISCPIDTSGLDMGGREPGAIKDMGLSTVRFKVTGEAQWDSWSRTNVAIHGMSRFSDGSQRLFTMGDSQREPGFIIVPSEPDTSEKGKKKATSADLLVGSLRERKGGEKKASYLPTFLESTGMTQKEFEAARMKIVPSSRPTEVGSDRTLVQAFDAAKLVPAYTALKTLIDLSRPEDTVLVIFHTTSGKGTSKDRLKALVENVVSAVVRQVKGEKYAELSGDITEFSRIMDLSPVKVKPKKGSENRNTEKAIPVGKGPIMGTVEPASKQGKSARLLGILSDKLEKSGVLFQDMPKGYEFDSSNTIGGILMKTVTETIGIHLPTVSGSRLETTVSKVDMWALYRAMLCFSTY